MRRLEVLQRLRAHQPELTKLGVTHLYLFGSTVRDEARPDSDVDLFFDLASGQKFSLCDLIETEQRLSTILSHKVDAMTRKGLHPVIRQQVEASAEQVF